ncbi:MAG: alpha/beta hydrolase [Rubrobacteraceae bacterium]
MRADAVRLRTGDDFELFGLVHDTDGARDVAVVFVHGLGSNGFIPFTDALAETLPEAGIGLLRGNLRDPELLRIDESPKTSEVSKGGGAFHRFEDSVEDLGSWVAEAERRGYGRVILFGHSLGSLKAVHYLYRTQDPRVAGLILASAADLVAMNEGRYTPEERARFLKIARELVREGRDRELMPPECTMGLMRQPVSAGSYLDRFGEPPAWDVMDLYDRGSAHAFVTLRAIRAPILALFGTVEEVVPEDRLDAVFQRLEHEASDAPSFESRVLEGGNHFYSGRGDEVAEVTLSWIRRAVLSARST